MVMDFLTKEKGRLLLLAISGILTGFSVAFPRYIGFLEWISLIPAAFFLLTMRDGERSTKRAAYRAGLVFWMSYYIVIYHWFWYMYPLDFAGISHAGGLTVVLVAWLGLSFLQAVGGAVIFPVFLALDRRRIFGEAVAPRVITLAALFCVSEFSQTLFWFGVPFARLCIGQSYYLPVIQSASLFGCYFITFLLLAVNALLALAAGVLLSREPRKRAAFLSSVGAGIIAVNLIFGCIRMALPTEGGATRVAAIQANISSTVKWDMSLEETYQRYEKLTREAAADGAEVIIWPETAIPTEVSPDASYGVRVAELAKELGVTLLYGCMTRDSEDRLYNTIFAINPDGSYAKERYNKRRLVPFGEYVPMRSIITMLIPPLANISMLEDDMTPGDGPGIINTKVAGAVGSLICFDSIYDTLALSSVNAGADWIALPTNDSWFSDSAAIHMHYAQAKLRAVETGRYIVRAGNTGISGIITDKGADITTLAPLREGYVIGEIVPTKSRTLYSYIGNIFVLLCLAFPLSELALSIVGGIGEKKKDDNGGNKNDT